MSDREWCPTMPPWVRRIPVGKGHDLNVMARTILEGLWFCAPVARGGAMFTGPVDLGRWTPTIAEIAEANGVTEVSARKALRLLITVGWITRKGRGLVLSWQAPHEFGGISLRHQRIAEGVPEDPLPEDPAACTRVTSSVTRGSTKQIPEDPSHLTTPLPHYPKLPQVKQATFALESPVAETPPSVCGTDAEIDAWWSSVFCPLRVETLDAVGIGARQIECTAKHRTAIRELLAQVCPGLPWHAHAERLTHVVRNAAARVVELRGKKTSYGWQSKKAIGPAHWLHVEKNFVGYYEADAAYGGTGDAAPLPEPKHEPGDRFAGMQAHELEREMM